MAQAGIDISDTTVFCFIVMLCKIMREGLPLGLPVVSHSICFVEYSIQFQSFMGYIPQMVLCTSY